MVPDGVTPLKSAARKRPTGVKFEPTPDQRQLVMLGAAMGLTQAQIAAQVNWPDGISEVTLRQHFADELDHGASRVLAKVAGNLLKIATDPMHPKSVTAAIFVLKARANWRDGGDITVNASASAQVTVTQQNAVLSADELRQLARSLANEV